MFAQSTGPENLFVNYLSRIHREEVRVPAPLHGHAPLTGLKFSAVFRPRRTLTLF